MSAKAEQPVDHSEGEDMEDSDDKNAVARNVRRQAEVLSSITNQLRQQMLCALPPAVKKRIKALKKLQIETINIESKYYEELHALECKYSKLYYPAFDKRAHIICGLYEPTEEDIAGISDDEKDEELSAEIKTKVKIEDVANQQDQKTEADMNNKNKDVQGIPDFWLTIFKNVGILAELVEDHDEPILKHLIDIKVIPLNDPMGFVLEFHFSPNEYFSNSVLTKEYEMTCKPDELDPFSFEGPEIVKCKGSIIDWQKGKNVTVKTIKKKQKHKSRGCVRTVNRVVQNESFFNFFNPPKIEDPDGEIDDDIRTVLTNDFEIGHYIRESIVPKAVLFFTGEILEDEYDESEEEEEEEEEEESGDEEVAQPKNNSRHKSSPTDAPNNECKQQ